MKPFYKILIAIGIGVLVILGIYLGWQAITSEPEEDIGTTPETAETSSSLITSPIKKISEETVFDFWTNPDTGEVFYFTPDGRVMNAKEGPDLEISKQTINALNFIEIGPKKQKVLAAFGDPQAPQWGIFDIIDGVWRPLPADIIKATWGDNEEKLITIVKSGNYQNFAEADITQMPPSYQILARDLRLKDVKLTSLSDNRVVISELPSASYAGSLWQFDLKSLNLNLLIASEYGLDISWSDKKDLAFLFGLNSGFSILDDNLRVKIPVPFVTLPQKCTADSSKIYCFVPQNIPSDTTLPDDYLTEKFFSVDDLFVLGIDSEEFTKMISSNTAGVPAVDAKNPRVSGNKIYFINRYDNGLYELSL